MEKLTVMQVIAHLQKKGIEVSEKQATDILKFMTLLAKISIENYLKRQKREDS